MTHNNLGALYENIGRFKGSENAYHKAMEIITKLVEKNPEVFKDHIARTQHNLGILYETLSKHQ